MRHITKAAVIIVPIVLLALAGVLAVRRLGGVAPIARSAIQQALSRALSRNVSIASAGIGSPGELVLHDVRIDDQPGRPLARIGTVRIGYAYRPGPNLLKNVRAIHIQDPVVNLSRDKQGRWNIQDLLELRRRARPSPFAARLIVSGGKVRLSDAAGKVPLKTAFDNLTADIQFLTSAEGAFSASARGSDGFVGVVSATGDFRPGGSETTVTASKLALEPMVTHFVAGKIVRVTSGTADIRAYVSAPPRARGWKDLDYVALADVRGCNLRVARLGEEIRNLSGRLTLAPNNFRAESAAANFGPGRLQIRGALLDWDKPSLNLAVTGSLDVARTLKAVGLGPLPHGLQVNSPAQVSLALTGPASDPSIRGQARIDKASLGHFQVNQAEAKVSYGGRRLALLGLTAHAGGGLVQGDAWISLEHPSKVVFRGGAHGIEAQPALAKAGVKAPLSGTASGPVIASWQPGKLRVVANASLASGRAYDLPVKSVYFDATKEKGRVAISRVSASSPAGALEASGRISDSGALGLDFSAANVDLARIAPAFDQKSLAGKADAWGRITGTLKDPAVDAYVQWAGAKFKKVGVDLLSARVNASRDAIRITEGIAYRNASEFTISGAVTAIDWHKRKARADISVQADRASLADLLETAGAKVDATGTAAASISISGPLDSLNLHGEANTADAFVHGQHIQSAGATFDWQDGNLRVQQFKAALPSSEITASGGIARDGSLDFHFKAPAFDLADLDMKSLAGADLGMSGKVSLIGEVGGTSKEPVIRASLQSPGFSVNGSKFGEADVEANLKGRVVTIEKAAVSHSTGTYSASGTIDTGQRALDLKIAVKDGDVSAIRSALEGLSPSFGQKWVRTGSRLASLPRPIRGMLNGTAIIAGPFATPRGTLEITRANMTIAEHELPDLQATVSFEWPKLKIVSAKATKGDAYATASGTIDLDGKTDLEIDGYNLSAQLLEPWLKPGTKIAGTGDLWIRISGTAESPSATGSAEFSDFSAEFSEFPFGRMAFERARVTLFGTDESGLKIEEMVLMKGPNYLSLSGRLPFTLPGFSVRGDEPPQIRMELKDQDLSFIKAFLPEVQDASGPVSASLVIAWPLLPKRGTRSQPVRPVLKEGFLTISEGHIILPAVGELKQVAADVAIRNNLVTFERLSAAGAKSGSFSVRPGSTIRIDDLSPKRFALNRFDVTATARDFAVRVGGAARGPVQADLHLTNSQDGNAVIKGKVTARSGWQLNLGKDSTSAKPWAYPLFDPALDITLEVQPFMYITSAATELAMSGKGRISGTLAQPALSVALEGRRGWLLFPAARVQLTFASAEISVHPSPASAEISVHPKPAGGFAQWAVLHLEGNATVSGYQIFVTLTGKVDDLTIARRSVPALSGHQVDSLLTAGVLPATGTGPGGPALQDTAREVLLTGLGTVALSPLERRFASGLGLEELSFEFNYGQPVKVRMGTYVLRGPVKGNLYLSYLRTLTGKAPTASVRTTYEILPSLSLGYSVDERDVTRIELQRTVHF